MPAHQPAVQIKTRAGGSRRTFNPILKAYLLAYLTTTIPRLPAIVKTFISAKIGVHEKWRLIWTVLTGSIGINRFPTSCALIVAGSTILSDMLWNQLVRLRSPRLPSQIDALIHVLQKSSTLMCTFATAWLAFDLLNRDGGSWARKRAKSRAAQQQAQSLWDPPNQHHLPPPGSHMTYAGKTIDLTSFAMCRALDVVVITAWLRTRSSRIHPENTAPRPSRYARILADPALFATSAAIIMWSWFYSPERLPKQYNQWISGVADIDDRLINALRLCRRGELVYGSATTKDANLPSLCEELGLPKIWGNPAKVVPIPCELYHCGAGPSCEIHAGKRFVATFKLAMRLYLPLQLVRLYRKSSPNGKFLISIAKDAARSSSFLAMFVGLFYYSVCLARTRIGPKVLSQCTITPQMWDSGLCVLVGCLACGWSVMLETASRRQEMAFFVAPRALATLLPRVYDQRYRRREQTAFATSVAIIMNAMQGKQRSVRGVLGQILKGVLR